MICSFALLSLIIIRHFANLLIIWISFIHFSEEKLFSRIVMMSDHTIVLLIQCITGESRVTLPKVKRGHHMDTVLLPWRFPLNQMSWRHLINGQYRRCDQEPQTATVQYHVFYLHWVSKKQACGKIKNRKHYLIRSAYRVVLWDDYTLQK